MDAGDAFAQLLALPGPGPLVVGGPGDLEYSAGR